MDDHEFAEFVMRYVDDLAIEISPAVLADGLQKRIAELSKWAEFTPLETRAAFSDRKFRYEIQVKVRVRGATDLLTVQVSLDEALVPRLLAVEEWDDFCDHLAGGVLMPALRVQTNRLLDAQDQRRRPAVWEELVDKIPLHQPIPTTTITSVTTSNEILPLGSVVLGNGDTLTITAGSLSVSTS